MHFRFTEYEIRIECESEIRRDPTISMKIKLLVSVVLGLCFLSASEAQSVVITKRTVTHRRPKARADHKKSFKINYPVVKAATPAVSNRIKAELDYFKLWKFTLREELSEIQWLEDADFEVKFNRGGILSVLMWIEGSGAYPDGSSKYIVIDTRTGRRLRAADLFTAHFELAGTLNRRMQKEIEQEKLRIKNDKETADIDTAELFEGKRFTVDLLD